MKKLLILLIFVLILYPSCCFAEEFIPNGKSGILMEVGSGEILFEKNIHERRSIASLTKMVAQIIILDDINSGKIHWDDVVTVSRNAAGMGGSQIYLEEGEKITVRDLMKGISVASGNDATVAIAEYISGSEEKFVDRMNDVIKRLKLKDTHFVNCTGLDEDNHYSSSYDLAMIARELLMNYPQILEFSSIYEDYLRENTDNKFWLVNTNKLIRFYDGADGLKTGHTDDAGYCLTATAKRDKLRLIAIVLGEDNSKTRNSEIMNLLDYGFQSVRMNCLKQKGSTIESIMFDMADKKVNVVMKDDLCVLENKGDNASYEYRIRLNNVSLPIKEGDVVGKINVLLNHKVITTGNLTVSEDVSKIKLATFLKKNFYNLLNGVL